MEEQPNEEQPNEEQPDEEQPDKKMEKQLGKILNNAINNYFPKNRKKISGYDIVGRKDLEFRTRSFIEVVEDNHDDFLKCPRFHSSVSEFCKRGVGALYFDVSLRSRLSKYIMTE